MSLHPSSAPPRRGARPGLSGRLARARRHGGTTLLLGVVAVVLVGAALRVGRPVLMPLALAGLLQLLLSPLVRRLRGLGLPAPVAAGALLLALAGALGYGAWRLTGPAIEWVGAIEDRLPEIERELRDLKEPLEGVAEASEKVEEMTAVGEGEAVLRVQEARSPMLDAVLSSAWELVVGVLFVGFLLFFMLARDDALLRKLPELTHDPDARERSIEVYRTVQHEVSTYLLTITLINAVLGCAVGVALFLLGVPNPVLWGTMVGVLNFVPYLGAMVGVVIIAVVSLLSDEVANPYLPPLAYAVLNSLEGMLFTPMILGRTLTLSPVAVFLWLILWGWLWGIPGALLAVPLLAVVKIVADEVPALRPVGCLLDR